MKALALHFLFEIKSGFRKKQQLFLNYLFPLGFFLMMGTVMPQLNPLFLNDLVPAMIIFSIITSTFMGIPDQIVSGRISGVFRGYRVNGVPRIPLLLLPVLSSVIHASIISAVILILSPVLFNAPLPKEFSAVFPLLLLTVFSCGGIGLLIGVLSSSTRVSTMLSQLFYVPSMLIGGLMIPYSVLPQSVRTAAVFLPTTHSMNLFKALTYGTETELSFVFSIVILAATGVATSLLSLIFFKWDNRKKGS